MSIPFYQMMDTYTAWFLMPSHHNANGTWSKIKGQAMRGRKRKKRNASWNLGLKGHLSHKAFPHLTAQHRLLADGLQALHPLGLGTGSKASLNSPSCPTSHWVPRRPQYLPGEHEQTLCADLKYLGPVQELPPAKPSSSVGDTTVGQWGGSHVTFSIRSSEAPGSSPCRTFETAWKNYWIILTYLNLGLGHASSDIRI